MNHENKKTIGIILVVTFHILVATITSVILKIDWTKMVMATIGIYAALALIVALRRLIYWLFE